MLTSSLLGNDHNEIDIRLPDPEAEQAEALRRQCAETAALRNQRRLAATQSRPIKKRAVRKALEERMQAKEALHQKHLPVSEPVIAMETSTITTAPIAPQQDPLLRIREAEELHFLKKQRLAEEQAKRAAAEEAYAKESQSAKGFCRSLQRKAVRQWKKEAAAIEVQKHLPQMERRMAIANVLLCSVLGLGIGTGMLILERPTISETENRTLASMPSFSLSDYWNGSYTAGVSEFYNDTVPFRELFKHLTATFRNYMGWQSGGAIIHGGRPQGDNTASSEVVTTTTAAQTTLSTNPAISITTTTTTTTTPPVVTQPEEHQGELSNNILIHKNRGIMLYGGSYRVGQNYASFLNAYQSELGPSVHIYSMVIPTPCSFYTPEEFQYLIGSEYDNIQNINAHLVDVTPVDAYGALAAHTDEYIYMRTDHHWSALGAFYAAEAFSAAARVPFAKISEYEKVTKPGYVGTLYGYSGDIALKNNPEDFFYYTPKAEYTTTYYNPSLGAKRTAPLLLNLDHLSPVSWYMVYLGGDARVTHVQTAVNNDRTLVIFKDSYGNALVPWLTSSFENIYVVDLRYFTPNAITYIQQVGATDVLFAMNTFSATGGNAKHIETLRIQ